MKTNYLSAPVTALNPSPVTIAAWDRRSPANSQKETKRTKVRGGGFAFLLAAFLGSCVMTELRAQVIVVPNALATNDGNTFGTSVSGPRSVRWLAIYDASQFGALSGPSFLTKFAYRPDRILGQSGPRSWTLRVYASTTSRSVGGLSTTFAENLGTNTTLVFDGTVNVTTGNLPGPGNTRQFDYVFPFTTPFLYDPAAGNLVLSLQIEGDGSAVTFDTVSGNSAIGQVYGSPSTATTGIIGSPDPHVTQFTFEPPPLVTIVVPGQSYLFPGADLTLGLNQTFNPPPAYQWQFNGANLPGATGPTLVLSNVTTNDSGLYRVTLSNAFEVVTTAPALVQVVDRVVITSQPQGTNATNGANVTFVVTALSPQPITFQWQFNDVDLPGQTSSTLALTNVQLAQDGLYTVVATDALRSVTSEPATLTVLVKPVIVQTPISQSVVAGGSVTFSAEITGNPAPFTYQWRQGSTTLTNLVLSEKRAFFTLNNVRTNQSGTYRVIIANPAAPTITGSSPTTTWTLTVLPDTDGDGLPDAWETAHGLNPANASDTLLDLDGDGLSNQAEYRSGTSPTNSASLLKLQGVAQANGTATVSFNAASNQTYTVEWCADLGSGTWTKLTDLIARPSNRTETVTDGTATDAARFYRVLTPRQP